MSSMRPARRVWRLDDVRRLGVTTSLATAAQILGVCYPTARRLAVAGTFPSRPSVSDDVGAFPPNRLSRW